ncbi:MAG: RHS repeat-associated core domain-containing protein [Dermatophilaceae bacterium]
MLLSDGERDYIYGPDGLPLQHLTSSSGANPAWYVSDHNGNTRALADATGAVTATYTYTAYGAPTRTSGAASTPLLYGRGHYDTDTGYIYLLHRYYDPATATFTTTDPLVSISGSPYGYVGGDPLNTTDPTGLLPVLGFAVGGAVTGAAFDLAGQVGRNLAGGCGPFDNIDWWSVGRSSVIGAVTGVAVLGIGNGVLKGLNAARAAKLGASGADDVLNGVRLRAQLAGEEISGGHAFGKHVVQGREFAGITTRSQFASHIEDVIANGVMRPLSNGRSAYWKDGTVVIRNPNAVDGGAAFRPANGYEYFLKLK